MRIFIFGEFFIFLRDFIGRDYGVGATQTGFYLHEKGLHSLSIVGREDWRRARLSKVVMV